MKLRAQVFLMPVVDIAGARFLTEGQCDRCQGCGMSGLQGSVETADKISPWFRGSWGLLGPGPLAG